jgi:hypothetical protein
MTGKSRFYCNNFNLLTIRNVINYIKLALMLLKFIPGQIISGSTA